MLKERMEEVMALRKDFTEQKESYEREIVEKSSELSHQRQIYLQEKESFE
jgi:hypothetical protein